LVDGDETIAVDDEQERGFRLLHLDEKGGC
jgi:hypothetical protein